MHRDLKSENILIDKNNGRVKIADFGVSCHLTKEQSSRNTHVGSPHMVAPELLN
jgi:serine/threonine protein kinase